ncbi:MAG: HU family DNA-binding protein [Bacteroidaceae bacterium]|nr:HU family DNA-binding protein [Bacteroidaceae bacterium]
MNNKEFISELAKRSDLSLKEASALMTNLVSEMTSRLEDEATVSISGFGNFEVKKKLERVVVNPSTKQRMLIPPKMVLNFRPSATLKEKL